jgi:prevent-host-death family protein
VAQVPIRELNQQTARVMARVEAGETIEVTKQGKVIGRIVPATTPSELDDLIAAGRVIPATIRGPIPMPAYKATPGSDAGELISNLRDEERW